MKYPNHFTKFLKHWLLIFVAYFVDTFKVSRELSEASKEKLSEFKLELARKHEKRRDIILEKRKEMDELRAEIEKLKTENAELKASRTENYVENCDEEIEQLRKENHDLKTLLSEKSCILAESEKIIEKNRELRISIVELQGELQRLNTEVLNFEKEREDYKVHVVALKDVIAVSKHMLQIRESQLKELKEKVESIEQNLASREATILSQDLRAEYEKQIANMRNLRLLYEERQRLERKEKEELTSQLADVAKDLEQEQKKNIELESRLSELQHDNSKKYDEIKNLESNFGLSKAESRQYQAELAVINQLFSETLLKYNASQDIDLDKLQKHLEENHGLLKDIVVNEVSSEVSSALPKVLLELINQLQETEEKVHAESSSEHQLLSDDEPECSNQNNLHQMNSAEEIVENLPKVWKVLIELLSHQTVPTNVLTDETSDEDPCYKKVDTPKGPSLVLSVSQTFIRLKDLILEKKSLEKETAHLKHLNGHLENRLQDQEKRLELVQNELSKTWLVVGKLQKQHQMLHTQEKILRYELAQKRKLLGELKEELEYSREKWAQAREKNSNTELQWKQLRTEFASRRNTTVEDVNNSAESGYSDDREGLSDEEPGYETDVSECAQKTGEDTENQDLEIEDLSEDNLPNQSDVLENTVDNNVSDVKSVCQSENNGNSRTLTGQDNLVQCEETKVTEKEKSSSTNECSDISKTRSSDSSQIETVNSLDRPSTSSSRVDDSRKAFEEMLAKKEARLKRLESQAESLVTQTTNTANRSIVISNRLDNLHETYGSNNEVENREDISAITERVENEEPNADSIEVMANEEARSDIEESRTERDT
ncbi:uncharacterized protein [Diabrotica undecimpunctata]|uniref:uncharacterized protein isoform X2 n=1 Tax=Diabrotica undecimpunctata TaxID=50387 RepID=UPI003B63EC75